MTRLNVGVIILLSKLLSLLDYMQYKKFKSILVMLNMKKNVKMQL